MLDRTKELLKDKVIQDTVVVTAGLLLGSLFSYLLQFYLGRSLSVEDYGTFNALLSLAYLVGIPTIVFNTSITKLVSELFGQSKLPQLSKLFSKLTLGLLSLGVLFLVIFIVFGSFLDSYLKIGDYFLIIVNGLFLSTSFLPIIPGSYLQGLLRFRSYAVYSVFSGVVRFIIPTVLVFLGYRLYGVFVGFLLSSILAYLFGYALLKKHFVSPQGIKMDGLYKKLFIVGMPALLFNSGMMVLNNIDVLMVKRYFPSVDVGYYAGVVTLGKIFLFGAGTVATVMFPQIAKLFSSKTNYRDTFVKFLAFQLILVLGGLCVFSAIPGFLTHLFFGVRFEASIILLPRFSIFIALYILVNFLALFFLAIEKYKLPIVLLPAVVVQFVLLNIFHRDLLEIINVNIAVTLVVLVIFIVFLIRDYVNNSSRTSL